MTSIGALPAQRGSIQGASSTAGEAAFDGPHSRSRPFPLGRPLAPPHNGGAPEPNLPRPARSSCLIPHATRQRAAVSALIVLVYLRRCLPARRQTTTPCRGNL